MNNFAAKLAQAVGLTPPQNSAAPPRATGHAEPVSAPVPIRAVSSIAASRPSPAPSAAALGGVPFPNQAQRTAFDALLRERGWAPPEDIAAQLAALDAPWGRLQLAIGETRKNQSANYHAHLADIASRTAAGDSTVKAEDSWTREDWQDDADERCRVFKSKCKEIEGQAWELAKPVLEAKADAVDALADWLEAEARPRFEQLHVAFHPPAYTLLARKYAQELRSGGLRTVGKPTAMIESL